MATSVVGAVGAVGVPPVELVTPKPVMTVPVPSVVQPEVYPWNELLSIETNVGVESILIPMAGQ